MIAFAPICECKNNRRIWHNASALRSPDVTDQLWRRHNVNAEKTVLSVNGEMSDRWLFVAEWGDRLPMIFTIDFVTRENHWQITSLTKSLSTVTHASSFIYTSKRYCCPHNISMDKSKIVVTQLLTYWSNCSLTMSHRYIIFFHIVRCSFIGLWTIIWWWYGYNEYR